MMLLARAITQKHAGRQNRNQAFNAENGNGESNQVVQRVSRTESNLGKANDQCYNYNEKGHYARDCQKPRVRDAKYFKEQMLLAMKDMTHWKSLQPKYDAKAISEVNASHKVHEQVNHMKHKTIIHTSDDNQIDSNIIFDDPYVQNNGGIFEHDSNAHDEYHAIQILAYNVQREAKNQKRLNNELKKQKELLQKELETCKERDPIERILKEKDKIESDFFKIENEKIIIKHETQLAKKAFKERENRYLEDIVDLEEKMSSHDRIAYKMGQSIQTIHMLGKTPNKVYDPFLKAGLGYQNPERLKKSIAA
ncbi:putative ribonuclease H-like domain-containing protein [Tanacetum coccineum]